MNTCDVCKIPSVAPLCSKHEKEIFDYYYPTRIRELVPTGVLYFELMHKGYYNKYKFQKFLKKINT